MLTETVIRLLRLVLDIIQGRTDELTTAKRLVEEAFESGVPATVLMQHLTESGKLTAEHVADVAEWAKLEGQRLRGES